MPGCPRSTWTRLRHRTSRWQSRWLGLQKRGAIVSWIGVGESHQAHRAGKCAKRTERDGLLRSVRHAVHFLGLSFHLVADLLEQSLVRGIRRSPAPRAEDQLAVRVPVNATINRGVETEVIGSVLDFHLGRWAHAHVRVRARVLGRSALTPVVIVVPVEISACVHHSKMRPTTQTITQHGKSRRTKARRARWGGGSVLAPEAGAGPGVLVAVWVGKGHQNELHSVEQLGHLVNHGVVCSQKVDNVP